MGLAFYGSMKLCGLSQGVVVVSSLLLVACGQESGEGGSSVFGNFSPLIQKSLMLMPNSPIKLGFERSESNPNVIVPANHNLLPYQYDVYVEPQLSADQSEALSLVTGVGVEAVIDTVVDGQPQAVQMPIRFALRAREWDISTQQFKGETRVFAAQGASLDNSQEFSIIDTQNANHVYTGLGLRLREGRFSKLELARKSLKDFKVGSQNGLSALNQINLPAGWAAIGIIIAIDKVNPMLPEREPFVEDIVIFSAQVYEK